MEYLIMKKQFVKNVFPLTFSTLNINVKVKYYILIVNWLVMVIVKDVKIIILQLMKSVERNKFLTVKNILKIIKILFRYVLGVMMDFI